MENVIRWQNKIAGSRLTLPMTVVYGIAVCLLADFWAQQYWIQFLLLAVSTALMVELNNSNSLIRIYSRMVSCSFLVLMLMSAFLLPSIEGGVLSLLFIIFYLFLLKAYQDKQAVGNVFVAFMAIGIASMFFVQILFLLPVFWLFMQTRIICLSWRMFFSSLLGILCPYWLVSGYFLYQGDYETPLQHFLQLAEVPVLFSGVDVLPTLLSQVSEHQLVTLCFLLILFITGGIHFFRQRSKDKLRTQMIYEMMIYLTFFIILLFILLPDKFDFLLRLLIVNTSVLLGHFIALTRTKVTNVAFFVILSLVLLLTAYNLWIPSLIY